MSRDASKAPRADSSPDPEIRALAAERRLAAAHLERWLALDAPSRSAMLAAARQLRLRTGQLAHALDLLAELALREQASVAAILARPELRTIVNGAGSAPGRARALLDALEALRRPQLRDALARLRAEVAALRLPRGISLVLPRDLASDELTVALRVRTRSELHALLEALEQKRPGLERILDLVGGKDLLGGKDEV